MIRSSGILLRFIVRLLGRETDYPKAEQLLGEQVKPIRTMEPHIRNGGQKPAHSAVAQLTEDWTHVLDEAEFRRPDMRKLRKRVHPSRAERPASSCNPKTSSGMLGPKF